MNKIDLETSPSITSTVETNLKNNSLEVSKEKQLNRSDSFFISLWRPTTWFNMTWTFNELKLDEIETEMLKCLKNPVDRFYVKLPKLSNSNIWTIAANRSSSKVPIVWIHGFCGAVGLW
jgi:hypothetical protein